MLKKSYWNFLLVMMAAILLVGCSSQEEELNEGVSAIHSAFETEGKEVNQTLDEIDVYLPFYFEVVEEIDNNVILSNGSEQFILFYNDQEDRLSKQNYEIALEQHEYIYNEVMETDTEFRYILISQVDEKTVEVTIGIGGKKITSQMKPKQIIDNAKAMTNIVRSVTLLPQEDVTE